MLRVGVFVCCLASAPALSLDKLGSAHGGSVAGATSGFNVSGAALFGFSVLNSSYAARPDLVQQFVSFYAAVSFDLAGRTIATTDKRTPASP
ncbi:MAG: hypothetical protein INH41_19770 [Myxococcaceae bacterium]|nr:hypothetical protein [Myxococcaceae bacterium]MCA3014627.1 hypothetical protein [Myxococcaceae bacterium]